MGRSVFLKFNQKCVYLSNEGAGLEFLFTFSSMEKGKELNINVQNHPALLQYPLHQKADWDLYVARFQPRCLVGPIQ